MISLIKKRIVSAFRTNEPQVSAVAMFTMINIIGILSEEDHTSVSAGWWLFALTFWPAVAFLINLISPIPKKDKFSV